MAKKTYPHKQSLRCLCMSLNYRLHKVVESTELRACLNGVSSNIDSLIIMTTPKLLWLTIHDSDNFYDPRNILTYDLWVPQLLWLTIYQSSFKTTPKIWFHLIMDLTIVSSCILFTFLFVNTELEHHATFVLWWSWSLINSILCGDLHLEALACRVKPKKHFVNRT